MVSTQIIVTFLSFIALTTSASLRLRSSEQSSPHSGQRQLVRIETPSRPSLSEEIIEEEEQTPIRITKIKLPTTDHYSRDVSNIQNRGTLTSYSTGSNNGGPIHQYDDKLAEEQAKNAKYSFASAVDDGIMDQSHFRQETRDGLKVVGSYSYSDGHFKRTTNYQADENGYRVLNEAVEPIGGGPQLDLVNGKADVHTQIDGVDTAYSISAQDIGHWNKEDTKTLKLKL